MNLLRRKSSSKEIRHLRASSFSSKNSALQSFPVNSRIPLSVMRNVFATSVKSSFVTPKTRLLASLQRKKLLKLNTIRSARLLRISRPTLLV
jgi:hypothetical protein